MNKTKYKDFTFAEHGFAGHLAEPDEGADKAVMVIMGGEKSIIPGIKIAERFADFGFMGLSVSLFGAEGLPRGVSEIPLDMFIPAVKYLREERRVKKLCVYGMSMGSVFASLTAMYIGGVDDLILVSPAHVPFEGTLADKKTMTGKSAVTWQGKELPYVKADFSQGGMNRYVYFEKEKRKVTRMYMAYYNAYRNKELEEKAALDLSGTGARILMTAGSADEMWCSEYSVKYLLESLDKAGYQKKYKGIIYPGASHLIGMTPNRERNKTLYRMMPLIGIFYRSLRENKAQCLEALEKSEREIIKFISE
ncbi:MAG: hypothetical protein NC078_10700 [Ruminococcus sp.]|nr:hypothetical protein [Ruminococcus sp.]